MLKITLIALGSRMPSWVDEGGLEYMRRLREWSDVQCVEIPLLKRSAATSLPGILDREADQMMSRIPQNAHVIALDMRGVSYSSESLATRIESLTIQSSHLCFLVGGPEGLHPRVLERAHSRWSLSALTLPHPLVRIVVLEALYRALSILHKHPYHK